MFILSEPHGTSKRSRILLLWGHPIPGGPGAVWSKLTRLTSNAFEGAIYIPVPLEANCYWKGGSTKGSLPPPRNILRFRSFRRAFSVFLRGIFIKFLHLKIQDVVMQFITFYNFIPLVLKRLLWMQ